VLPGDELPARSEVLAGDGAPARDEVAHRLLAPG
jgi:hypothetical protein